MEDEFRRNNLDNTKIKWILKPEKNDITDEVKKQVLKPGISECNYNMIDAYNLPSGVIVCTLKHYAALKDIVDNGYDYAVIMEDNMQFKGDVSKAVEIYIEQLNRLYPDWDIIFDRDGCNYTEQLLKEGQLVYAKNIERAGAAKCAQFYLLTKNCAKKMFENYIPFNQAPDDFMNDLFRKLDIKVFWAEPSNVTSWYHISTAWT
jgi:GR25 family glycosyltransferase involved in LPS biosynthesis